MFIQRDPPSIDFDDLPEWHQTLVASLSLIGAIAGPTLVWTSGGELSIVAKIVFTPISVFIGLGVGLTVGVLLPVAFIATALGAVVYLLVSWIGLLAPSVIPHLPTAGIVALLLFSAFSLYRLRLRSLLLFGIAHLLVGVIMIYPLADMVVTLIKKVDIDGGNSTLPLWYPIVAMVYFLVQGLVFVSKGVKGTKFEKKWGRLFDKKRKR